jgi:hypothetical protein
VGQNTFDNDEPGKGAGRELPGKIDLSHPPRSEARDKLILPQPWAG